MKHECRFCKHFGPRVFMGGARCHVLRVVQATGVIVYSPTPYEGQNENPMPSVSVDFGCIHWREAGDENHN